MAYVARPPVVVPPGESILWTGAPSAGLRLRRVDALAIPFSIMWGGFAIFWETMAVSSRGPLFMQLWGIPFVLVGLYLIVGRFFVDAALRSQTSYTVTDQAVYITRAGLFRAVRRYAGSALDAIQCELAADGSGTIRFVSPAPLWSMFMGSRSWSFWNDTSLDALQYIPDAERVYGLIISTRAK